MTHPPPPVLHPARLRPTDLLRLGLVGPRARPLRSVLSALGIALGMAAVVAVTGISASNQAHLLDRLDRLGSNLITVSPGTDVNQQPMPLPKESVAMLGAIASVQQASATGDTKAAIYSTDLIPANQTNGLSVRSARLSLFDALRARLHSGRWLDRGTAKLPVVILGDSAAHLLGVDAPGQKVWIGGKHQGVHSEWYLVLGILQPNELAPEIDNSALVGEAQATARLDGDRAPSTVYVRARPENVAEVQAIAGATANPAAPNMVAVSRPSDLLKARAETKDTLSGLVLSLAGVSLLVGGVGIANTMVVGIMERSGEIGLRRALGARQGQIAIQFLVEAFLLGLLGGLTGVTVGAVAVYAYAAAHTWPATVPVVWVAIGPATAVAVGTIAGLYPALRAARMSPTGALRTAA
ncbi:ABC transporter permease [Streptomyces sp. NPDC048279]|uniref:ABC transporter permease n=1 Tax=Streptomyces sp. NPDC048279 TaxID=3154714 RepID=UPI003445E4B9